MRPIHKRILYLRRAMAMMTGEYTPKTVENAYYSFDRDALDGLWLHMQTHHERGDRFRYAPRKKNARSP